MNYKKYWCLIIVLLVTVDVSAVGGRGGLSRLFRARNDAADVYHWAKEGSRDTLRVLISCGCALGVFNYLRSAKNAGKLIAFMESSGVFTTVYQLLGLLRKFTINPLARLLPWVAAKRRIKLGHTEALSRFLRARDIKTDDQLPSDDQVRTKTEKKMMEKLRTQIGHGGLDADTNWVEKLMVKDEPAYAGKGPEELLRCIDYINDPQKYTMYGATLRKGLLLVGAPGGGKTTLARLIAYHTGSPLIEDSPASLMNTFVGTGPNALKDIFDNAESAALAAHRKQKQEHEQQLRRRAGFFGSIWRAIKRVILKRRPVDLPIKPTILCLNELDSIAGQRGASANDHQERRNTLDQLLASMDNKDSHIFVVGSSNEATAFFDEALIRPGRMGQPIRIPLPDDADRFEIIKYYMQKAARLSPLVRIPGFVKFEWLEQLQHNKTPFDTMLPRSKPGRYAFWRSMVERTRGFSGDELRQLFNDAAMIAGDAEVLAEDTQKRYMGRAHFEQALQSMLAEMPQDRRERCRAGRSESIPNFVPGLGSRVAVTMKERVRDLNPDEATMDEEDVSPI